jgi:hypothetical protein
VDANPIETDYLVIGGGATAMAFVDTLLSESDAQIVMVDRNHRPGGHWNHAYSFVGLHQPSAFYGVNSRELGNWTKDETGLNQACLIVVRLRSAELFQPGHATALSALGPGPMVPMSNYSRSPDGVHHFESPVNGSSRQASHARSS